MGVSLGDKIYRDGVDITPDDIYAHHEKTDKKMYVSAINCPKQLAYETMMDTKRRYGKLGGNVAYHGYQSFKTGEVTPQEAHTIGMETARRMWGDDYEIVVTTQNAEDYGAQLPEHVILRFARFLLPKIQEDLEKKD